MLRETRETRETRRARLESLRELYRANAWSAADQPEVLGRAIANSEFVVSAWTMREVFALTTRLFLAFGIAFELPVLVFFLSIIAFFLFANTIIVDLKKAD